jgi:hypothetical protein
MLRNEIRMDCREAVSTLDCLHFLFCFFSCIYYFTGDIFALAVSLLIQTYERGTYMGNCCYCSPRKTWGDTDITVLLSRF